MDRRQFVKRTTKAGIGLGLFGPFLTAGYTQAQPAIDRKLLSLTPKTAAGIHFSFIYNGKHSRDFVPTWRRTYRTQPKANGTERHISTYTDPATGLEVSSEVTHFHNVNAVEYLIRLRNTGSQDTPIIEDVLPIDLQFAVPVGGSIVLHSVRGSIGVSEDFEPIDQEIASGTELALMHYVLEGAKHVGGQFPFFNLEWQGGGLIGAVGWTGQWQCQVKRDSARRLTLQAGQQRTHLKLHPGESIRTPRILLLEWKGKDRALGHNQLRRLLLAHYTPRIRGKIATPPVAAINQGVYVYDTILKKTGEDPLAVLRRWSRHDMGHIPDEALNWVNEENELDFIRGMPPLGMEANWIDAGWFAGGWPYGVGNWMPDSTKFPDGLKPVGDATHTKKLKFLLWFEPGRVAPETRIWKQHAEWILHHSGEGKLGGLFNLGDPVARLWMEDLLSERIQDYGIDIYRHDSNICPLPFWQAANLPERQGITEIRWVEGLYALWDELLKRHPDLMIDNANWRITGPDIEVMSRSVGSLTRSEVDCDNLPHPIVDQAQTAELCRWVPLHSTLAAELDPYSFRSAATSGIGVCWAFRAKYIPLDQLEDGIAELKSLRPFWLGDYYPLTKIDLNDQAWCGWQFHRTDLASGFAVFFRRPKSPQPTLETSLRGLDAVASYQISFAETYETKNTRVMTGKELGHLRVEIRSAPGTLLIRYHKLATA